MKISKKNIRASALQEFWNNEYTDSLYLWEGAKHLLTLSEMENVTVETMSDLFASVEEIIAASEYCKQFYFKILPKLSVVLNHIAGLSLPDSFWRTTFGYWLFRHICVVYEKYSYLSKIDVDQTSIKLLDMDSFYIPYNHWDYVYCFSNDFGVQQLVSHYYYLFKKSEFSSISMNFDLTSGKIVNDITSDNFTLSKRIFNYGKYLVQKASRGPAWIRRKIAPDVEPTIVLCGVSYTNDVATALFSGSKGKIGPISPPSVNCNEYTVDTEHRKQLLNIGSENDFEYFFVQTLYYCLPRMFLEQFRHYYNVFAKDIKNKKFTHIVSEYWISDIPSSIYIAIAQSEGRRLVCCEHGSGYVFDMTCLYWIDMQVADGYVTIGWKIDDKKIIQGGFMCRDIKPYQFQTKKTNILYVARTNFPYLMEFDVYNATNTKFVKALKQIRDIYSLLPEALRNDFVFRPRKEDHFWDTERALEVKKKNIRVDNGNFSDSIANAKIVIIDHLSTGAAEMLLMKVPCLIMQDEQHAPPILKEIDEIFDELKRCGVIHNTPQSLVFHLSSIHDNIRHWWLSERVQASINRLVAKTLAPSSKTVDYFLSCLNDNAA